MQTGKFADWLQIVSDGYAQISSVTLAMSGEEPGTVWAKSLKTPNELTDEEIVKLDAFMRTYWYYRMRTEYLAEAGFASLTPEEYAAGAVHEYLDTPFGIAWWTETADGFGMLAPRTRQAIQNTISARPDLHLGEMVHLERIRTRLSELPLEE